MVVALLVTRALWMDTIWLIAQGRGHSLTYAAARQMRQGGSTRLQTRSAGLVCGLQGTVDLWRIKTSQRKAS
eukprot:3496007-Pleurochrysis_carterae.AAC.5